MMIPLEQLEMTVRAIVRECLADMLGLNQQKTPTWMALQDAVTYLGYDSDRSLYRDIEDGLLRIGHEVQDRRRPGSKKGRYYLHIPKTEARLNVPAEARR